MFPGLEETRCHVSCSAGYAVLTFAAQSPRRPPQRRRLRHTPTSRLVDTLVPMRDGVHLHTSIWIPQGYTGPVAIVFKRTPYGIDGAGGQLKLGNPRFANWRATDMPLRSRTFAASTAAKGRSSCSARRGTADPKAIDEGSDTCDTMEWLVKRVPGNNGRIGMLGVSYDGWLVVQALMDPHPGVQGRIAAGVAGGHVDGGRLSPSGRVPPVVRLRVRLRNGAQQGLRHRSSPSTAPIPTAGISNSAALARKPARSSRARFPTWNDYVAHPDYDEFWKTQAAVPYLNRPVTVPTLNVAGWWDQEDFYGPVTIYREMEKHDAEQHELPGGRSLESWRLGWYRQGRSAPSISERIRRTGTAPRCSARSSRAT